MNVKAIIAFNGNGFLGWQSQKNLKLNQKTIQQTLQKVLTGIYKQEIKDKLYERDLILEFEKKVVYEN